MNYDQLFSFAVFAEHLNFTRAAEALALSQPALHVQVRKLGAAVGVPLYNKRGRSLELTDAGRALAAHAREVKRREAQMIASLRGQVLRSPVALASGRGALLYVLAPTIRRFPRKRWPLELIPMSAADSVSAVLEGRADVAITVAGAVPDGLKATRLRRVGQTVVLPRGHRLAGRKRLRASDLDGEAIIVAPPGQPHRRSLDDAFRDAGASYTVAALAQGWELMLQLAALGAGIVVVNDFCPVPPRMVGVPLSGMSTVDLLVLRRRDCTHPGAAHLEALAREHVTD